MEKEIEHMEIEENILSLKKQIEDEKLDLEVLRDDIDNAKSLKDGLATESYEIRKNIEKLEKINSDLQISIS
jgi:hypothetical protein